MQKQQERNCKSLKVVSAKQFLRVAYRQNNLRGRGSPRSRLSLLKPANKAFLGRKSSKFVVKFTQNNIFVSLVSPGSSELTFSISGGIVGLEGRSRQSADSAHRIIDKLIQLILRESIGPFGLEFVGQARLHRLFLRKFIALSRMRVRAPFRSAFSQGTNSSSKVRLKMPILQCVFIKERKNRPFNGCRSPKMRRK